MSQTTNIKPNTSFEINNVKYMILNEDLERKLDDSFNKISEYITSNNGKGKPEEEKNSLYAEAQKLWSKFKNNLDETKYNFNLNKDQWKFLTDLILKKLDYDINTVFIAIEINKLLTDMSDAKFTENEIKTFSVNATEITYIYHLISSHKVKGIGKDSYSFADILRRIADISKLVNYYDNSGKNIAADIQDWVALFEDNVEKDKSVTTNE